jgi:predicted nuclease with TOPRIM domain
MSWHSHRDYAEVLHRHRHAEAAIERLEEAAHRFQSRLTRLEETFARLAGALELLAGEYEETWRADNANEAHLTVAEELASTFGRLQGVLDAAGPCPCGCTRGNQPDTDSSSAGQ